MKRTMHASPRQPSSRRAQQSTRGRQLACVAILSGLVPGLFASPAAADEKTERVVGDILRILIDSQQNRGDDPQGPPGVRIRPQDLPPVQPNVNPRQVILKELEFIIRDTAELANLLGSGLRRNPAWQPLLNDSAKLNASSSMVYTRAERTNDYRLLFNDVKSLDAQVKAFTFDVSRVPGLPRQIRELSEHLDEHSANIGQFYGFDKPFDPAALQNEANALMTLVRTLQEDVQWDYGRSAQHRGLVNQGLTVNRSVANFVNAVNAGLPPNKLVASYQAVARDLQPWHQQLVALNNQYLNRNLGRLATTDQSIHQMLRIPRGINRQQLAVLSKALREDIANLCNGITLSMLMRMPGGSQMPAAADELDGVCAHFADCVQRNETDAELVDAFSYIPGSWRGFSRLFAGVRNADLQRQLAQIGSHVQGLQTALQLPTGTDLRNPVQIASSIEREANQLAQVVRQWLARNDIRSANSRRILVNGVLALEQRAHALEQALISQGSDNVIRRATSELFETWKQLNPELNQCRTQERAAIQQLQQSITSSLVALETMLIL